MKIHRLLFTSAAILLAFSSVSIAAETKVEAKKEKPAIKDEFLQFALEKAKLYSENGEQAIGKAVDLAQREAPELAKEWLRWRFWRSIIYCVLCTITIWPCIWAMKKGHAIGDEGGAFMCVMGGFALVGSIILVATVAAPALIDAIQIAIAPRIYIAEQLINLIK